MGIDPRGRLAHLDFDMNRLIKATHDLSKKMRQVKRYDYHTWRERADAELNNWTATIHAAVHSAIDLGLLDEKEKKE